MEPNANPTPAPAPGSGKRELPAGDPLPPLGDAINQAYAASHAAAIETGRSLVRARRLLMRQDDWVAWLTGTCNLTTKTAKRYMDLAAKDEEGRKASPPPFPPSDVTVVCGWCLHARSEQDLPPKHLSGPRWAEHVRHGQCDECREAVEQTLKRFRQKDSLTLDATEEDLSAYRAVEWNLACSKLRSAFHHTDEAFDAMRTLSDFENLGLTHGVKEAIRKLVKIQDRLRKLTCELLLLSEGSFFDASLFDPGVADEDDDEDEDEEEELGWHDDAHWEDEDDELEGYGGPDA